MAQDLVNKCSNKAVDIEAALLHIVKHDIGRINHIEDLLIAENHMKEVKRSFDQDIREELQEEIPNSDRGTNQPINYLL
jgi:hypothetical protein